MKKHLLCWLIACAALSIPTAHASIVCVAPTATAAGSLQITAPISFTINTTAAAFGFDLDEWVISDGSPFGDGVYPAVALSLDGAALSESCTFYDNAAGGTANDITANDGILNFGFSTLAVKAGDTLTLLPGAYSLPAGLGFNPQATKTFSGNIFVFANGGARISNVVAAVPEPSAWAALGLGTVGLGLTLRRRAAHA